MGASEAPAPAEYLPPMCATIARERPTIASGASALFARVFSLPWLQRLVGCFRASCGEDFTGGRLFAVRPSDKTEEEFTHITHLKVCV